MRTVSIVIPYRIQHRKHLHNLRLTRFKMINLFEAIVSTILALINSLVYRQPFPSLQSYLISGHLHMCSRFSLGNMSSQSYSLVSCKYRYHRHSSVSEQCKVYRVQIQIISSVGIQRNSIQTQPNLFVSRVCAVRKRLLPHF